MVVSQLEEDVANEQFADLDAAIADTRQSRPEAYSGDVYDIFQFWCNLMYTAGLEEVNDDAFGSDDGELSTILVTYKAKIRDASWNWETEDKIIDVVLRNRFFDEVRD